MIVSTAKLKYGVHAGQAVEGLLVANACFEQTVRHRCRQYNGYQIHRFLRG